MSNKGDKEPINVAKTFVSNRLQYSKVDFSKEDNMERLIAFDNVFKILISIYGKSFADQFDNKYARDVWFNSLLIFSTKEITDAIELLLRDEAVSTINLKKYMKYCRDAKKGINNKETGRLPTLKIGKNNY